MTYTTHNEKNDLDGHNKTGTPYWHAAIKETLGNDFGKSKDIRFEIIAPFREDTTPASIKYP